MSRLLLALLLSLVLAWFGGAGAPASVDGAAAATSPGGDDCCPPRPAGQGQVGDCCDVDLGKCCGAGVAAVLPQAGTGAWWRGGAPEERAWLPVRRPLARASGPPPTPPPIG